MKINPNKMLACALMSLALCKPALAEDAKWETRTIKDAKQVSFDPTKAYILVQSSPIGSITTFYPVPTEQERVKDQEERSVALAKAHEKWVRAYARWEATDPANRGRGMLAPKDPPVEPTDSTFSWPTLEMKRQVVLGPINRFHKSKEVSLYLQEVPPAEYVFYGSVGLNLAKCACMGTVKFEAVPGKVTTLLIDNVYLDERGGLLDTDHKPPKGVPQNDANVRSTWVVGPSNELANDPRIPEELLRPAQFSAMPKLPNWLGAEINRIMPIEGVLAYDRGEVIDLKARANPGPGMSAEAELSEPEEPESAVEGVVLSSPDTEQPAIN